MLTYEDIGNLELKNRDQVNIDLVRGILTNKRNNRSVSIGRFSEVQMKIYQKGGLLRGERL